LRWKTMVIKIMGGGKINRGAGWREWRLTGSKQGLSIKRGAGSSQTKIYRQRQDLLPFLH
jgi:hypothetical protein